MKPRCYLGPNMAPAALGVWTWQVSELCLLLKGQREQFLALEQHISFSKLRLLRNYSTYPVPYTFNHIIGYLVID